MVDFRPISLCNILYKIIAKVITNRLKVILLRIIFKSQSAFLFIRQITDNKKKCNKYVNKKKEDTSKQGYLSIKLDTSNKYDRV